MIRKERLRFVAAHLNCETSKMYYRALREFSIVADDPLNGKSSLPLDIPEDHIFSVIAKQRDMFDPDIEYWTNRFGWIFKVEKRHLELLEELK